MKKNYIKNIGLFLIKGLPLIVVFIYCLNCIRFDVEPRTETTQNAVYTQEYETTYVSKSIREQISVQSIGFLNRSILYYEDVEYPSEVKLFANGDEEVYSYIIDITIYCESEEELDGYLWLTYNTNNSQLSIYISDWESYFTSTYVATFTFASVDSYNNFIVNEDEDIGAFFTTILRSCRDFANEMIGDYANGFYFTGKYKSLVSSTQIVDSIYYEPQGTHSVYKLVTEEVTQEITNKPLIVCYNICDCFNNAFNITSVTAFNDMYVWLTNNLLNATPITHAIFNLVVYELIVDLFICIIAVVTYPFKLFRKD